MRGETGFGSGIAVRAIGIAASLMVWLAVGVLASAWAAAPAFAGWSPATPVEKGVDPLLAFGPSGDAAIGSRQLCCHGTESAATFLAVRLSHRHFGPPSRFGRMPNPDAADSPAGLQAIALPSDGAAVALFGPGFGSLPQAIKAFVEPRGTARFGAAQQIVGRGNANGNAQVANVTTVVDTTRGEVIEAGLDDSSKLSTATLARGSRRFVIARRAPASLGSSDGPATLATDDAGGTFLAGDGVRGCTTVAYRPPRGRFRTSYQVSDCSGVTKNPNVVRGLAATGDGYATLLTENVGDVGTGPSTLLVQVGRFGRFGAPTLLSPDLLGLPPQFGIAIDRDGSATVFWRGCMPGKRDCGVYGEQGSVYSGFAGQPALIAAGAPNVRLSGLVGDRAVAVQQCAAHRRCTISVALADRGGRFGARAPITTDGRRPQLQSDSRGDLLLVWTNHRGIVYAATRIARAPHLGPPHQLSGPGVNASTVTSAYGPSGEAIVAWSLHSGRTIAAVYDQTG